MLSFRLYSITKLGINETTISTNISLFSERLKILRKDINTCERIEKSEPDVENKIGTILEIEQQQKNKTQNRNRGYSRDER